MKSKLFLNGIHTVWVFAHRRRPNIEHHENLGHSIITKDKQNKKKTRSFLFDTIANTIGTEAN
jgi:hypothetical protein